MAAFGVHGCVVTVLLGLICISPAWNRQFEKNNIEYSYPEEPDRSQGKWTEIKSQWAPLLATLKYTEEMNTKETLSDDRPLNANLENIFELLYSGELLTNEIFLDTMALKIAGDLERHGFSKYSEEDTTSSNEIVKKTLTEEDNVINKVDNVQINDNCSRDFARMLEPITNKIGWQVYNLLCELGFLSRTQCNALSRSYVRNTMFPIVDITMWGLSMLDYFGKPGHSITQLNIHWVGDFDACNSLTGVYEFGGRNNKENSTVKGQYCRMGINMENLTLPLGLSLFMGMCVPDTCNAAEAAQYVMTGDYVISTVFDMVNLEVRNTFCGHDFDVAEDTGAMIAVIFVVCVIILVAVATIYDAFIRPHIYTKKMPHENKVMHSNGDNPIADIQTQISTVSNASTSKLFQTQLSWSSNNTHLSDTIHNHETQESISCCQRLEIMLVSFSAYSNIKFIFRDKRPVGWLHSLDGFRVLSAIWVIFGYSFIFGTLYAESWTTVNGIMKTMDWVKTVWYQIVVNFHLAGDTFLVINGCLVTYWWMKTCALNDNKITPLMMIRFYLHRYWRLIPTTLVVILVYSNLYKILTEGPLNPPKIMDAENCKDNWWLSLFMLQNLIKKDEQCVSYSWIVAVAFQLHFVTPLILVPLVKKPVVGVLMWILMFASYFVSSAIVIPDAMPGGFQGMSILGLYYDILQAPWTRASGYVIGIAVGFILFKTKCKINMPKIVSILGWMISGAILLFTVLITHEQFNEGLWNETETTIYLMFSKVGWSIAIGYMIIACETNNGAGIGRFLKWGPWQGLAPVIFIMMLITPILIFRNVYSKRQTMYLEVTQIVYHWTGNVFTIFCISLIASIAVEHPLRNITRAWFFETKDQAIMAGHHRKEKNSKEA